MAMVSAVTGEAINIVSGVDTSQSRIVQIATQLSGLNLKPEHRELVVTSVPGH